jgi:biotin carboxyl carrier protein
VPAGERDGRLRASTAGRVPAAGTVRALHVMPGERVSAGRLVAEVDPAHGGCG